MPATVDQRAVAASEPEAGIGRWVIYQRERFPLLAHGPVILAFSAAAVAFSAQLRGPGVRPSTASLAVAFVSCLLFFFQLRVADEFKDLEDDTRWRPYRPVPRGLVTLRELGGLGVGAMVVQLALALWLSPALLPLLLLVWAYMALMGREFWLHDWLATRPLAVIATHMMIMPIIDLYATACDWLVVGGGVPHGLHWFLIASFFNGVVIEVGRKVRAPEDEEPGVLTYTAAWGRPRALAGWLLAMVVTAACAVLAAREIGAGVPVAVILGVILTLAIVAGAAFLRRPTTARARWIPGLAGTWTILMYVSVGILPLVFRA